MRCTETNFDTWHFLIWNVILLQWHSQEKFWTGVARVSFLINFIVFNDAILWTYVFFKFFWYNSYHQEIKENTNKYLVCMFQRANGENELDYLRKTRDNWVWSVSAFIISLPEVEKSQKIDKRKQTH